MNSFKLRDLHDGLKADISATLDLEIKVLRDEISKKYCYGLSVLATAFGITKDLCEDLSQFLALFSVVTAKPGPDDPSLFAWTETTADNFLLTYKAAINDITLTTSSAQWTMMLMNVSRITSHTFSWLSLVFTPNRGIRMSRLKTISEDNKNSKYTSILKEKRGLPQRLPWTLRTTTSPKLLCKILLPM
jgi:hypothetical protein